VVVSLINTSSINCKYNVAGDSLSLVSNTRRGSGSLQVTIGGSGSRPSKLMLGETASSSATVAVEVLRKMPGLAGMLTAGAN